jgi:chromate transporter
VGTAALAANLLGVHEVLLLLGAGAVVMLVRRVQRPAALAGLPVMPVMPFLPPASLGTAAPLAAPGAAGLGPLFLVFLKIGSILFGSGYVLLAYLRADLVQRLGWLSENQLLDAITVGQVTPGPVLTTATFIGALIAGAPGAVLATAGIFMPAFVFVAASGPLVPRLRRSPAAGAFLDGVNMASLALMAVVSLQLGRAALVDAWTLALAVLSAILLLVWRVSSVWLLAGGALAGVLLRGGFG